MTARSGVAPDPPSEPRHRRWNPLTPLAVAVFLIAIAYAGPSPWAPAGALLAALTFATLTGAGARVFTLAMLVGVPTFALLFLMNGIVATEDLPLVRYGPVSFAPAAVEPALRIALRLAAAIAALGWLVLIVEPRRLARALAQRGLPAWAAYVLIASLDAIPQARRRAGEVLDAQRARGLRVHGGAAGVRALLPTTGPLMVSLVAEAEERALALDARGFRPNARRTALDALDDPASERAFRLTLWIGVVAAVVLRLMPGTGG